VNGEYEPVPPRRRRLRSRRVLVATSVVLLAGSSGCGDDARSTGRSRSPASLLEDARAALSGVGCYHVRARYPKSAAFKSAVDYEGEVLGDRTKGEYAIHQVGTTVVRIGTSLYLFMSPQYLSSINGGQPGWKNRWVLSPFVPDVAAPGVVATPEVLRLLSTNATVTEEKASTAQPDGTTTVLFDIGSGEQVRARISDTGPAYPRHIDVLVSGQSQATLDLDDFGKQCHIDRPPNALKVSK
jgi:hypothetical protein